MSAMEKELARKNPLPKGKKKGKDSRSYAPRGQGYLYGKKLEEKTGVKK